ncbi:MAG TPA: N-methyl-L-tryptophan oxidase [Chloroflexota bacterium]|nr:N-methyl-L-tryptophan oxidase [Chloroflexota bacterium]
MSDPPYDVIIVGLGAMGSAAAYQLAHRGQRVLGLDAFPRGHTLGSSHGETRIIRMAYFEHPNYVPLLRRAYELWDQTAAASSTQLLHLTGGLFIGPPQGDLVAGSLRSAQTHGLPHALLDADEIRRRFPMLRPQSHEVGVFEERAGVLLPERCIDAQLDLAAAAGADLRHAAAVERWTARGGEVVVDTAAERFAGARLILTAGAWAGKLLRELELPLQPERIPLFWFEALRDPHQFDLGQMPIWIWHDPAGAFFTTPHVAWPGVKIGKHHSLQYVDPDTVEREVSAADEAPLRSFLERCVPDLAGSIAQSRVCMYTNTPDEHFLIDVHPAHPAVVYACGFSGHGFKFASVVGEILADLAMTGRATPDADFLRAARLSDPQTGAGASR